MLRIVVQLALLVSSCMAASQTQDVGEANPPLPWFIKSQTQILNIKDDLALPHDDCALKEEVDDLTGLVKYNGDHMLQTDNPCYKDYVHVACEVFGASPKFDRNTGQDVCVLENNDRTHWPVSIKLTAAKDSFKVFAQHKGGATWNEPFVGTFVIEAENTNVVDMNKVISTLSSGTDRILFVAEGIHFDKVQTHLAQMPPEPMLAHVIRYTADRPHAVYNAMLDSLASNPENPVKKVILLLNPGTAPNPIMLQRVAALLKQGTGVVMEWFDAPCTLGDYATPKLCQEHRVDSWKLYRQVTWERCPTDQMKIVEDLSLNFKKMNPWVQNVSNWLAGCDHHGLDSSSQKQWVQDIGCDDEKPPRCQDEKDGSMDCKVRQLEYYNSIMCACFFLLVAIVVAIGAFVYQKFPDLRDGEIVGKASEDAAEKMKLKLMEASGGVGRTPRNDKS